MVEPCLFLLSAIASFSKVLEKYKNYIVLTRAECGTKNENMRSKSSRINVVFLLLL